MPSVKARPCEEGTIQSTRAVQDCAASAKPWVLLATILASSIANIDESIVNVALPAIETDLATSVIVVQWLINAYTLTLSSLLLVGGAAGDRFGRRRSFIIGISIFAAASLWCGISPNVTQLISARAVQGVGAALLIPSSLAIIGATFAENERGKAIGTWAGFSALAAAAGPLLGGWIVDHFSWRWIFFVNPLLTLPTVWIALYRVPESRDPDAQPELDWQGALLVLIGLGSITYGLIALPILQWSDPFVLAALSVGLILLGTFMWVEGRSRTPMLSLAMFRSRTFSVINILTLLLYGALGGAFFFLPFVLIQVRGYPAEIAGAAFLPFAIIIAGLSRWAGGLLDSFGARLPLVIGPAISALGLGLMAWMVSRGPFWEFLIPIVILGFGIVISVAPLATTVINSVPPNKTGIASGINNAAASVANLFAVAILGAVALGIFNHALDRHLQSATVSTGVQQAIRAAHGSFVIEPALSNIQGADRRAAETIIKGSLAQSIRSVMLIAAVLAISAAAVATLLPRSIEITDPNDS